MCKLQCAPDYAYGNRNIGPIPANSTLDFEVELLDWAPAGSKEAQDSFPFQTVLFVVCFGISLVLLKMFLQ